MLLFAGWGLWAITGSAVCWFIGPIVLYILIPILDLAIGDDPSNAPEDVVAWLEQDRYYRWVIYAFLPLQFASFFAGFWLMTRHGGLAVDRPASASP